MPDASELPTIIDLFSGVGGISLGAAKAGFSVEAAIDFNARAMAAHARNFPLTRHLTADLSKFDGASLLSELGIRKPDGIVGGPPCQGFSTMGHRNVDDSRNNLFGHYFKLISEIKPRFFIAENVTGILDENYKDTVDRALASVEKDYNVLRGLEVCAADFGAPTTRRRVVFIGLRKNETSDLANLSDGFTSHKKFFVRDALSGLPRIRSAWQAEEQGWRQVGEYADNEFASRLHSDIPRGVGCPTAIGKLQKSRMVSGFLGTLHSEIVRKRYDKLKPGAKDPISKSVRLKMDGFCPTLRAGTGPELGSYQAVRPIHPTAPRVITPREAARLQGFPDWFTFDATKWHSFRMIGNSVSPILAEKLLLKLKEYL